LFPIKKDPAYLSALIYQLIYQLSEASHAFIEISSGSETEWTSASDWAETDDFDWVPAEYRCVDRVDRIVSKRRRCGSSWLSSATSYFEPCGECVDSQISPLKRNCHEVGLDFGRFLLGLSAFFMGEWGI